mgnify:CR=1 FL=1
MKKASPSHKKCQVCGKLFSSSDLFPAASVRGSISELIREENEGWNKEGYICQADLAKYRGQRVERLLVSERGELTSLEKDVVESLREHEILASNTEQSYENDTTLGQRLADKVATFGGSWHFIIIFSCILFGWILVNSTTLLSSGFQSDTFDPYPYILLNLVLSCIAAMQAPVIMMSQNRQDAKDRTRATHEYQINLKAELEIRHLHEKMDHLLSHQWERMMEIQQLQVEMLTELDSRRSQ